MRRPKPKIKRTHAVGVSGGDLVGLGVDETGEEAIPPGRTIGFHERYEMLGLIGTGGMGEVRLCRDRTVGREVAMKVIRPRMGSNAPRKWRFIREARVQGQLEHPSVVPLYEIGIDPDGNLYFTMQRVRGVSLDDVLAALATGDPSASRRYSRRRLLTVFSQICLTADFIHTRGVVHRDLKPKNVMLGEFGEVYLLDWGLSKILDRVEPELIDASGASTTGQGSVLGTPGYMSPEQLRGEVERVDGRSDVYSLGVLLFEMLALEPMHPRGGMQQKLLSVLQTDGARPGERRPARGIDPALDEIVAQATRLDPDDRYATAGAFAEAVEDYLYRPDG